MSSGKISGMTDALAVAANDLIEISQWAAGPVYTTKRINASYILTYLAGTFAPLASPSLTGTVTVGTYTTVSDGSLITALPGGSTNQLGVSSEGTSQLYANRYTTNGSPPSFLLGKARGTIASPSAVSLGDTVGQFAWNAYGTTAFHTTARIIAQITETGTPSDTALGTKLIGEVTPIGSVTRVAGFTVINNDFSVPGTVTTSALTYASLPPLPVAGARGFIADGNTSVSFASTVTAGGGSGKGPVYYDGTNWRWG